MRTPAEVTVVEVGPRDGLQNEAKAVPLAAKRALIEALDQAGCPRIEVGSFVSPRWVPQMADTGALAQSLPLLRATTSVLVPNAKGLEAALATDVPEIAVFAAASETFSQKNTRCSRDEAAARLVPVIRQAKAEGRFVRVYVSCVVACPYEGPVAPAAVARLAEKLMAAGGDEVSLGDTIGRATPRDTQAVIDAVALAVPLSQIAWHGHDTYGQALANVLAALDRGVTVIDAAVAGLGGCPFAPGAAGNLATEDLVYMLDGLGVRTDIDLDRLAAAGQKICQTLERSPTGRVALALERQSVFRHA
ncbi:MAG: hydroxymethylglutaryl-CoA lyase [Geminicoccaceae bacterium]|nr:MAG: hydroxymethylglutaryl-CoA lyase [Geminicoccaceae bacterium]